ncbi:two-component response regulator [Gracilibacillus boraciitolerans JCM 21714]|uniref:Two-component response regulator n=1 Tax=Gracilibacillus boraciitolerans JCM 21714 TaxID=1298598 RepID=W4VJ53_9BACI|nr:AraC family transcriptional regulator [Gracilibacillus boraciitolerans]GAE93247.1 two-component response regulator [Gracilibacillus boraciitolerans JCM 21714]
MIKEIRDSISELNRDRALLYVAKYLNIIDNKLLEPDIVEREILKLIYLVIETVQAKELARSEYLFMNYIPHVEIKEIKSKSEMKIWLKTQIEGILAGLDRNNKDKHPCIQKAIQFIEKNFNQPITLNEVAEYVDMNATYFSYLFKEEMGISYIKYVTEVRINKAKTMLEKGEKVTDVSEQVGYHTYRHFF